MTELDDSYEPAETESRWRETWRDSSLYEYEDTGAPDYVIDTPPPYPTGDFHIGNALGWCYMDYAARFHRMIGDDVAFPQGWDCHGLPTEVKVEEDHGIHRTEVSREEFRRLCIEHTEEQIEAMRETMHMLGFSHDWSMEFRTMDPSYWGLTQRSFVEMAEDDYVYRDEHPVNWCPRCQTAIADAEVEAEDRTGRLHTIRFAGVGNDDVEIATTRPELLPACVAVAVDPDDERYAGRTGETFEVPLFGQAVELIEDEAVDAAFGTGAVMICTFGDKQDVEWWAEYDLPTREAVTEDGRLNELADGFEGLEIDAARTAIADALEEAGALLEVDPLEQSVGVCWRCDTPIEILSTEQWFVRVDAEEILEHARAVEWIPEHMYRRFEDWTLGMDWDWVISRQRVFATPIPAWECDACGHVHVADVEEVPVEPTNADPAIGDCPECGASAWTGESDVMDTWMDSSISAMYVAGWPEEPFEPVQLREQGHDIIRTWAFYSVLRTAALTDEIPWEEALINGIVLGADGHKMSKSRDNFVQPEEVVEEYGADAFRQAMALAGRPGTDVQFQWKEAKSASRFQTKLWNMTRFALEHLEPGVADLEGPAHRDVDAWILDRARETAAAVEADMREYRFDRALRRVREFAWEDLADEYLELCKGRLYGGRPGERDAARHTLHHVIAASIGMLAPFAPFIADELWSHLPDTEGSVHEAAWPTVPEPVSGSAAAGAVAVEVASAVRAWKSDRGLALNAPLGKVEVYHDVDVEAAVDTYDLSDTINAPVYVREGSPSVERVPVEVDIDHRTIGPAFRDQAGAVVEALETADPAEIQAELVSTGEVEVAVDGEVLTVEGSALEVREELRAGDGAPVEILETDAATVLVYPEA
ncbi:MAG: valine--tRNA ligase [Halobacteriota archaeon]